ncbi:hypothetical protein SOCEGT47_081290 [Sorangium cellulosum]|uniref:DUF4328 domain-containing protein n=1 Tax=Sorangium cellulosum TaxID=56 RepID=A0A4P2QCR9_SORCE|nr:DUF4328 domain-containing protein [Sorangium cellulosum]AUX27535.1 hypothetical protein SOCEGT47_081290 [Sorangium cellulosum]
MRGWDEAREGWDRDVRVARARARAAIIALIAMAALSGFAGLVGAWHIVLLRLTDVPAPTWALANTLREIGGLSELVLVPVTGVLFLRWLSRAVAVTDALGIDRGFPWTPFQAVTAFFIPFVNVVRPYSVLRDLHDHLAPDGVPEPAPRPLLDGAGGYRRVEMVHAPRAGAVHHGAIGAWWGLYLASGWLALLASRMRAQTVAEFIQARTAFIASDVVSLLAALLAVLMVRAIDSRLAERHRRTRHASDEELDGRLVERDRRLREDFAKLPGLGSLQ